ncbi:MAG TPA: ABC transporter permease [Bryobacteraceae bacterium]|nr:ABC transporter permease [Bryobacteraceae bacterium]
MNWTTFFAMLARDAHVARRNLPALLTQTMLQPLLFTFVFGRVMISSGLMASTYKGMLVPGIMGMSMVMTGIQAVSMPLIAEFQFTREIEDRLLAPMRIEWLAVEKILAGMVQALVSGTVVVGVAWLILGTGVGLSVQEPVLFVTVVVLVALFSAAGGLALGCTVGQTQIGLMFSLVLAPMIFFGCVYYPWSALGGFPVIQKLVLLNPLVYASEGLRGTMAPQYPHIPAIIVAAALAVIDVVLIVTGLSRFNAKAVS